MEEIRELQRAFARMRFPNDETGTIRRNPNQGKGRETGVHNVTVDIDRTDDDKADGGEAGGACGGKDGAVGGAKSKKNKP